MDQDEQQQKAPSVVSSVIEGLSHVGSFIVSAISRKKETADSNMDVDPPCHGTLNAEELEEISEAEFASRVDSCSGDQIVVR